MIVMVETLPSSGRGASEKPLVAVIGDSEDLLEAIEGCRDRLEFIVLPIVPIEPSFWAVRRLSGVLICGLDQFARFRETNSSREIAVLVAVKNLDEFSAALGAGALTVVIQPLNSSVLLAQLENQLHLIDGRRRSAELLAGQNEILRMIDRGGAPERTIEAVALLIEKIEPEVQCAILPINRRESTFSNIFAPSLPPVCKVRLLETPVRPPILNLERQNSDDRFADLLVDLVADARWNNAPWAKALTTEGFRAALFIPIVNSKRQPLALLSLFGRDASKVLGSETQCARSAAHLVGIAFGMNEWDENLGIERERLSLALAAAKLGIWNWDLLTNEIAWSEQCSLFFGLPPSKKVTFEDFLSALHPKDRDRTMKAIESSIQEGVPYDIEHRVVHPGGLVRWIWASGRTFRDEFDQPTRMSGVARDVTERRQFDEELQENQYQLRVALNSAELARREAETATRAKDQFLAVLSHELRTPLTPIMMAASWLRNAPGLSEQSRDAFEMIFRNAELEARLIDDLLDLTRISRNQLELQFRPVDLHVVLRAAIEVCETGIQQKKQRLTLQLAAKHSCVQCDVARIQQVFWNLLKNAIKFTPEGGNIFVTSRNEVEEIVVEISDSGIGIDPRIIPKIFVPFEQGDKDVVKQFGGLGLGLAISKAILDAHGGTIAVQSEGKDLGAAFTVRLRLTVEQEMNANSFEK